MLSILEQQLVVVELIEEVLDRGLSVAIGAEHGFEPLASCALVVSPLLVDGEDAGIIGVLGPTRMHYPQALAAVKIVGEQLGAHLGRISAGRRSAPGGRCGRSRDGRQAPWPLTTTPSSAWRPDATDEEIKRAYRRMARELHPDTNGGDAQAEARFKEVTRAYEVLRDPARRARYDRFGPEGADVRGAGGRHGPVLRVGGIGDLFDAFFGGAAGGGGRRRVVRCGATMPRSSSSCRFATPCSARDMT